MKDRLTISVTGKEKYIPFASFLEVVTNTLSILQDLDSALSDGKNPSVVWRIEEVSMNSPLTMTIFAECTTEEDVAHDIIDAYTNGVQELARDAAVIPPHFTVQTLKELKQLTNVLNDGVADVVFSGHGGISVAPTKQVTTNIDALIGPDEFDEYTTVEGRLETLSVHKRRRFSIYDTLHESRIACYFPKKMLDDATGAFDKRIAVTGKARYNRKGFPFSIKVDSLCVLRDAAELPQMRDLEGINITDGVDPTTYVREMRDAD